MADDRDEAQQTEEPTQRKLDEAHEHGDLVKSSELTTLIMLSAATLAIALFGKSSAENLGRSFMMFLEQPDQIAIGGPELIGIFRGMAIKTALALGPVVGLMMAAGVGANLIQNRPTLTFEKIKPDLSKLNIVSAFGRMFGKDGLMNIVKGIIKLSIVGAAIWMEVWPERGSIGRVLEMSPQGVAGDMTHLLFKIAYATLTALAVIAGADYFWQRMQFMKRNRMSKHEIKDEMRQSEGDPAIKSKIRQIRNERARKRMIAAVPGATVVIMNPTHFAVALKYESGKMAAPLCVAKGVDALALRIREVAEENDVPVVENPPLARALYAAIDVDEVVPPEHYKAVAQVIGYVLKLTGKLRR